MSKILSNLPGATVPVILVMGISAGVVFPQSSTFAAPLVFPALFLLLTLSLSLATDRPLTILTKPDPAVWGIMLWQLAFIPLLVIVIGWAFEFPPDLHLMLLATAVSSTVFAAPTVAHLLNSPLKKALLTGFHSTAKHNATKAVSPSSETMRTI